MPDVLMPRLSDTMTEGVISSWLKREGEQVTRGEVIAEIETDKATMELEAYDSGVLTRIIAREGDTVPIGQPIAVIGSAGAAAGAAASAAATPAAPASGDTTTPASATPAPATPAPTTPAPAAPTPATPGGPQARLRATPLVRRLAREHDIDLTTVTGTGPEGRIIRADIESLIAEGPAAAPTPAPPGPGVLVSTRPLPGVDDERVPLTSIRRITAQRLTEAAAVPHFQLSATADAGALQALRAELNADRAVKISVTDLLIRACAVALPDHPDLNSSWGGDHLVRHHRINIGCAVSTDAGLLVPVIGDADHKTVAEIAAQAADLIGRARAGRLAAGELTGGTFTISNLGMFGVENFTAIVNPPEAAILAVGAVRSQPVVSDGALTVGHTLTLTLGVDHRVADGATAARFLQDLVALLEHPVRILV